VVTLLYKLVRNESGWQEEDCAWNDLPQIIGLEYEQFLRTVLIAQGSFANFLTAKENERYELLEKLVGCEDMYARIFEEIKLKKDESEFAYNEIKTQIEVYEKDDLSPEELQALNQKIEELEEADKKLVQELETVGKALAWYTDEEKHQNNIRTYKLGWEATKAALDDMKERTERLALHDATLQAVDLYKEQKSKGDSLRQIAKDLEALSDEMAKKNNEKASEEKLCKDLEEKLNKATSQLSEQRPLINKARAVKVECEAAKTNVVEKNKTQTKAKEELDNAKKRLDANRENINKKTSDLTNAQKDYDELKESVDKEREALKKQADEAVQAYEQEAKQLEGKKMEELLKAKDEATACSHDLKEAIRILQGWKEKENQKAALEAEKEQFF
jgi:DNA repair exonuclease SbcCD ATPase subunit